MFLRLTNGSKQSFTIDLLWGDYAGLKFDCDTWNTKEKWNRVTDL